MAAASTKDASRTFDRTITDAPSSGAIDKSVSVKRKRLLLREFWLVENLRRREMERVKGIEPSYSAWKAAALPLSYTRAGDELTRRAGGLNPPCALYSLFKTALFPPAPTPVRGPLTGADSPPILIFPSTMKGGDPVSFTKRCHLAGIAR